MESQGLSMTTQLLLAVKAKDCFHADTDGLLSQKLSNLFPGTAAQQSMKLRRAAYITKEKSFKTSSDSDKEKKNDPQSLKGILNIDAADSAVDGSREIKTGESEEDIDESERQFGTLPGVGYNNNSSSSINNLNGGSSISSTTPAQDEYSELLSAIKTAEEHNRTLRDFIKRAKRLALDSTSCVDANRLEYYSARLIRARQLNVSPADRLQGAKENYAQWCRNQRNLAVRKAKIDEEEFRKKRAPKAVLGSMKRRGTKQTLGNLFNDDLERIEDVNFSGSEMDLMKEEESLLLKQPLSTEDKSSLQVIEDACANVISQYHAHLATFEGHSMSVTGSAADVQFNESNKQDDYLANRALEHETESTHSDAFIEAREVSGSFDLSDERGSHENSKQSEMQQFHIAKSMRRFSVATPSGISRKSSVGISHAGVTSTEKIAADSSNSLKVATVLRSFATSSASNITEFETEQLQRRMRRCLIMAADAVSKKFCTEGDGIDVQDFTVRISEKDRSVRDIAAYITKINDGIAESYYKQIKDAHQLVLQQQLTRLQRLQVLC